MGQINKQVLLNNIEYYETHLSIINSILPVKMTPMESKVLARFMALEGDIAKYKFGATGRKIVRNGLGISTTGLSNYIKQLTDNKFLRGSGEAIEIWPLLIPEEKQQLYYFKLVNLDRTTDDPASP